MRRGALALTTKTVASANAAQLSKSPKKYYLCLFLNAFGSKYRANDAECGVSSSSQFGYDYDYYEVNASRTKANVKQTDRVY